MALDADYTAANGSVYGSFAGGAIKARNIDSSEFEFDADELAYIAERGIPLDQTQTWTGSAGGSRRFDGWTIYADALYGSGQRNGFANQTHLAAYHPVNIGISRVMVLRRGDKLTLRLDVANVFDETYQLDDGTGIGVGAPRYGARRAIYGGLNWKS